jgi:CarD family transcriptional regulator, regulator of rRNA transcription
MRSPEAPHLVAVQNKAVPPPGTARFRVRDTEVEMTTAKATVAPVAAKKVPANSNRKLDFKTNDHVVYPTHGVGRIMRIEEQEVAGTKLELFVITFDKDKMTLRVPTMKAKAVGMRKLSSPDTVATALNTLKGRARIKRTMWSRRAQEYEAKINSGDLVSIAEVVRDLHRASGQPEQSYSERQLYEAALARMAREVAAVERIDEASAVKRVEGALLKKAA